MTVSSQTIRQEYAGDGTTTVFSFPNFFLAAADLTVILTNNTTGVETLQVITTNYTVSGAGAAAGGSVTMIVAPASGETLTIINDPDLTQGLDLVENDPSPAESMEEAWDRLTMITQNLKSDITRSIRRSEGAVGSFDTTLPTPASLEVLQFNNAKTALVSTPLTTTDATLATQAEAEEGSDNLTRMSPLRVLQSITQNARSTGDFYNLGLDAVTTTNANDSIRITSADGTALSSTNPGYVVMASATSGLLSKFTITADVTFDLTGATAGEAIDLTDYLWSVYAINDSGSLKWGVSPIPNHFKIVNADDVSTAATLTSVEKVLVNSALSADSAALEFGWFKANYDHTGGAAEKLWAIQTSVGDINLGVRPKLKQVFTGTTGFSTGTVTSFWWREDEHICIDWRESTSGAPAAATYATTAPSGITANTSKILDTATDVTVLGRGQVIDSTGNFWVNVVYTSTTQAFLALGIADETTIPSTYVGAGSGSRVTDGLPVSFGSGDKILCSYKFPATNWD